MTGRRLQFQMENTLNMGRFLEANGKYEQAIEKYTKICLETEKILKENLNSEVDIRWTIYSLGYISEIYANKHDFHKALLWRDAQAGFLEFLNDLQKNDSEENISTEEKNSKFLELFQLVHAAHDDREVIESVKRIIKQNEEAKQKEQRADIMKQMRELEERHREQMNQSKIYHFAELLIDHPIIAAIIFGFIIMAILLSLLYFVPKPRGRAVPIGDLSQDVRAIEQAITRLRSAAKQKHEKEL